MNLNINKEAISIEGKVFNLNDIDFILHNGKIRIYKKDGTIQTILGGYLQEETRLCFLDIAYSIAHINSNFTIVNNNTLLNLNNIKSINQQSSGISIITKGFNLEINNISEDQKTTINDKVAKRKMFSNTVSL